MHVPEHANLTVTFFRGFVISVFVDRVWQNLHLPHFFRHSWLPLSSDIVLDYVATQWFGLEILLSAGTIFVAD